MEKLSDILRAAGLTPTHLSVKNNWIMTFFTDQTQAQACYDLLKSEVEAVFEPREIQCVEMTSLSLEGALLGYSVEAWLHLILPREMWEEHKSPITNPSQSTL